MHAPVTIQAQFDVTNFFWPVGKERTAGRINTGGHYIKAAAFVSLTSRQIDQGRRRRMVVEAKRIGRAAVPCRCVDEAIWIGTCSRRAEITVRRVKGLGTERLTVAFVNMVPGVA